MTRENFDLIFVCSCILIYAIVTGWKSIQAYRRKDKEDFKGWFPYFLLTFTGIAPVIIVGVIALGGFVVGVCWLCVEKIPNMITKNFDK
jgi:uncharacterized membrane protein